ncbi:MAG: hypothetical protein II838_03475 [Lachnospiraceae bacterium]|jgi:hypothetical protein|nr:hypothetical protein [Lachnospiraceae bacterium]
MIRNIKAQVQILLRQKGANVCFLLLMLCVILNYYKNLKIYSGFEKICFPSIATLFTMSDWLDGIGYYIIIFLPFLIALPAGLSLAKETKTNVHIYLVTRCGGKFSYYFSKICAVFIVTFLVFFIPFMVELLLNWYTFSNGLSKDALDVLWSYDTHQEGMGTLINTMAFHYPVRYIFIHILYVCFFAGGLAMIPLACSFFYDKYQAYLMMPLYFAFAAFDRMHIKILGSKSTHYYSDYFVWLDGQATSYDMKRMAFFVGILSIVSSLLILICAMKGEKK